MRIYLQLESQYLNETFEVWCVYLPGAGWSAEAGDGRQVAYGLTWEELLQNLTRLASI